MASRCCCREDAVMNKAKAIATRAPLVIGEQGYFFVGGHYEDGSDC